MHGEVRQRLPRIENRKLLDLAHRVKHCVNCGKATPEGCEPAHSNEQRHGRGKDSKAYDHHHFAGCHECHHWYDEATRSMDPTGIWEPTKESKREFFTTMEGRTMDIYFGNGWLGVTA